MGKMVLKAMFLVKKRIYIGKMGKKQTNMVFKILVKNSCYRKQYVKLGPGFDRIYHGDTCVCLACFSGGDVVW